MADANIRAVITAEDRASGVVKNFSSQLQSLAQIAGGAFALDKVIGFGEQFVAAFQENQAAVAQLNAVLQSTGDVSGVTASQAINLSKSLQQVTTFSDEAVLKAENLLLTFTNIGQSTFPEATKAVLDMSTALGQDTSNSAIQLGKALQDPVLGVTALRRVGVAFNQTQRETIQNLVDTGRGLEAQKMILKEVETEFGGSAKAMAQTFGGQLQLLRNNLNDVEESMGNVIANALRPLVLGINDYVQNNGQFVTSLGLAALVAGGFAAAVIAVAGAIAIAMAVLGPFTIILVAISALLGGLVFNAMQNFQKKMGDTTKQFADGSKSIATNGANNFGAAGNAASDLAQKLGDIDQQMARATRDFQEQMAQMVQDHQQKVTDLKRQIDDETKTFTQAQDDQTRSHEQKVRDMESQIKALQITNSQADQQRINDLRVSLAQENEGYQKDVANATQAHEAKANDLQQKLDAETAFLKKHGDDIAAVQNVQLLDELDKLKRSHEEQMAEFDKQKQRAIQSAQQTTSGMAGAFNDLPNQINGGLLNGVGSELGRNMATALKDSFKQTWNDFVSSMENKLAPLGEALLKVGDASRALIGGPLPRFASGVENFGGGMAIVGEQGPELVSLPRGSSVTPNDKLGGSYHITIQAGAFMGNPSDARRYAELIIQHINDVAGKKNMTGAQMLGA